MHLYATRSVLTLTRSVSEASQPISSLTLRVSISPLLLQGTARPHNRFPRLRFGLVSLRRLMYISVWAARSIALGSLLSRAQDQGRLGFSYSCDALQACYQMLPSVTEFEKSPSPHSQFSARAQPLQEPGTGNQQLAIPPSLLVHGHIWTESPCARSRAIWAFVLLRGASDMVQNGYKSGTKFKNPPALPNRGADRGLSVSKNVPCLAAASGSALALRCLRLLLFKACLHRAG